VARSYRLDQADAADVVQTTWLRLLEHWTGSRTRPGWSAGWSPRARRECLRVLRRSGRERLIVDEDATLEIVDDDTEPVETRLITNERNATLWQAFRRLPERLPAATADCGGGCRRRTTRCRRRWACRSAASARPGPACLVQLRKLLVGSGLIGSEDGSGPGSRP